MSKWKPANTDGVFTFDSNWRITSFNKAAEKITCVPRDEARGQLCKDVLKTDICEKDCALRYTMATGDPVENKNVWIVNARGDRRQISVSTALLKDENGQVMAGRC